MATFDYQQLSDLVDELIDKLVLLGGAGVEVRIVGGAALALAYDPNRIATSDVDVLGSNNRDLVERAAVEVAAEHGLPPDWLNFKVVMYAPDPDHPEPAFTVLRERDGIRISVGSPRLLLAMKLHAGRGRRDVEDFDVLLDTCGVTSASEAIEIFEAHYRAEELKPRSRAYLEDRFG